MVYDGSGLSRHDLVTPETMVKVLVAIQRDTAFQAFYDALPIAGVDGTISNRMRGTPAQNNMHAKTGTIEFVRSLSGYVTTADNERLVFSFLSNHLTTPVSEISRVRTLSVRFSPATAADGRSDPCRRGERADSCSHRASCRRASRDGQRSWKDSRGTRRCDDDISAMGQLVDGRLRCPIRRPATGCASRCS